MHFVHLTNPYRQNVKHYNFIGVPCSLGSICKYWIFVNKDTSSIKTDWTYVQMQCYRKNQVFLIVLPLTHNQNNKKIQPIILETFTKKNLLRKLTRFHDGLFEPWILEMFTTAFLLKTIIWILIFFFKHCKMLSFKTKKKSQERCKPPKDCLT